MITESKPHLIEADRYSEMASKKRIREVGAESWVGDSSSPGDEIAQQQQPAAKRPRLAGFGLGSSVGALVDKVVKATASFLGRGR